MRWLMEKDQAYTIAVVAALLSCKGFEREWDQLDALQRCSVGVSGSANARTAPHAPQETNGGGPPLTQSSSVSSALLLPPAARTGTQGTTVVDYHTRPAPRRSRVVLFCTDLTMAEALLTVAVYFFDARTAAAPSRTRSSPSSPSTHPTPAAMSAATTTTDHGHPPNNKQPSIPPHRDQTAAVEKTVKMEGLRTTPEEEIAVASAFERVSAAMNGAIYCSGTYGHLPVDCGIPIQWVPMAYTEASKERLLSPFSDEEFLLILHPESHRCTRLRLERWTLQSPQRVTYGEKSSDPPHRFTCRVTMEEEVSPDPLLGAALRDVVRFWRRAERCSTPSTSQRPDGQPSMKVLDKLMSWLWWQAVVLEERGRRLLWLPTATTATTATTTMPSPPLCPFLPAEQLLTLDELSGDTAVVPPPPPQQRLGREGSPLPRNPQTPLTTTRTVTMATAAADDRDAVLPGLTPALEARLRQEGQHFLARHVVHRRTNPSLPPRASASASTSLVPPRRQTASSVPSPPTFGSWLGRLGFHCLCSPSLSQSRNDPDQSSNNSRSGDTVNARTPTTTVAAPTPAAAPAAHRDHPLMDVFQFSSSPPSMGLQLQRLLLGR